MNKVDKNSAYSTTTFLETKEIKEDVIILKDDSLRSVVMVSSLNFDLKSDEERGAILAQFQDLVNTVDFPIQILINSRRLIIDDYLKDIKEKEAKQTNELLKMQTGEYAEFIKSFIDLHTVMSKTFYLVVPYSKNFQLKKPSGFSGFFGKKSKNAGSSLSELEEFARSKVQLFQRVNNIIGSLSNLGLSAAHLQTDELKELLFRAYNPGEEKRDIDFSKVTDLNSLLAPSGIMVESDYLKIAKKYSKTFYTFSYPRYLTDAWLEAVINLDLIFDISLFIHPSDTATLVKSLRGRVAEVQSQISANEEKGIVRDPVLETAYQDLEELRDKLQQGTEKFFRVGLYVTIYAETLEALKKDESVLLSLFDARLISLKEATFMQEDGFNATLPLGLDRLLVHTPMNTEPIASFFPFVSTDLSSGHGVLYGINRHNNSLIIFDRFSLQNGNMILFATSGAGKSYTAKLEVLREMMMGTDVIIIDPEAEYQYLAETVGGTFIKISLTSPHHINPFELPPSLKDESNADVLKEAIISLEGLIRLLIGKLDPEEDAILEKALIETYASKDITPESDFSKIEAPIFTDFYRILSEMRGGAPIAQRLEKPCMLF
ncbi:MAG: DUF87 domain-containing protein [Candidatus Staskawiczbacteria bacterium]|nr:DUF87 domain-containing protein [Candidatus Staskawiczbacteria bacterium]